MSLVSYKKAFYQTILRGTALLLLTICISALTTTEKSETEYTRLQKLELRALRNSTGKVYIYDLTRKPGCNKTRIKYLGIVHTSKGKRYKVLTSFFVFSASATCHGSSRIKIFDLNNRYLG
jgi:hypothetical protein